MRISKSKEDVKTYIAKLKYALENDKVKITYQKKRQTDKTRNLRFTNEYTIANLFSDENPVLAIKREIATLSIKDYMYCEKDTKYPKRSDMFVFAKYYDDYVYIKLRVELLSQLGNYIFVLSFHYTDVPINDGCFPYR